MMKIEQILMLWSTLLIINFAVLPFTTFFLGWGFNKGLWVGIMVSCSLIDTFTTYVGFCRGFKEANPFYQIISEKLSQKGFLWLTQLLAVLLIIFIVTFFPEGLFPIITALFLIGGLGNSIMLAFLPI